MSPGRVTKARPTRGEAANEGTFDMAIKFRKGDIVSIQGSVKYDTAEDDTFVSVWIGATADTVMPKPSELTLVRQKIEIGDMVSFTLPPIGRDPEGVRVGRVLAISNDHLWLDLGGGEYCTRLSDKVERLEAES